MADLEERVQKCKKSKMSISSFLLCLSVYSGAVLSIGYLGKLAYDIHTHNQEEKRQMIERSKPIPPELVTQVTELIEGEDGRMSKKEIEEFYHAMKRAYHPLFENIRFEHMGNKVRIDYDYSLGTHMEYEETIKEKRKEVIKSRIMDPILSFSPINAGEVTLKDLQAYVDYKTQKNNQSQGEK